MQKLSGILFTLFLFLTAVQSQETSIDFHTPAEWKGETIQLPPGFAPDLKWNGVEHIRFAPGMFKPESESFFSYLLVFLLKEGEDVSDESVKAQVLTYYKGLANAVMGGKQKSVDTSGFSIDLKAMTGDLKSLPGPATGKAPKAWSGTLNWIEPFRTEKEQALNFEVHLWLNKNAPVIYFTVSPQATDHAIWEEMRKHRTAFEIK